MGETLNNQRIAALSAPAFAVQAGANPVLLLPLGSLEDHGPNLPMGDFRLAEVLAGRIASRCAAAGVQAYAAPALPFGVADYFGASAGGMAISAASFRGVLGDLLAGFRRQGLTNIVILNGHGGNAPVIHEVTLGLRVQYGQVVPSFYLWKVARVLMERELGAAGAGRFGHGAEPLLSLSQALLPGLQPATVPPPMAGEMLGLAVSGFGTVAFEGVPVDVPAEFGEAPNEAMRQAAPLADAALGARVAAQLVAIAARFVGQFAGRT